MKFGTRIHSLRRLQKRTLKDVAVRCGFTISLLSKIESGKTIPPIATLTRIAAALGVSLADLLEEGNGDTTTLTRSSELTRDTLTDKGYAFHLLAANRSVKAMQPILFKAKRGKIKPGLMSHGGEEFVYVLKGRMRYTVGDRSYTLGPGDALYFDAEQKHDLEPLTASVEFLAVFSERAGSPTTVQRRSL